MAEEVGNKYQEILVVTCGIPSRKRRNVLVKAGGKKLYLR
jgi:hypothetical protein